MYVWGDLFHLFISYSILMRCDRHFGRIIIRFEKRWLRSTQQNYENTSQTRDASPHVQHQVCHNTCIATETTFNILQPRIAVVDCTPQALTPIHKYGRSSTGDVLSASSLLFSTAQHQIQHPSKWNADGHSPPSSPKLAMSMSGSQMTETWKRSLNPTTIP